jgi:hypothetical protein
MKNIIPSVILFTSLLFLGACEKKDILSDEEKQVLGTWQALEIRVSPLESQEIQLSADCINEAFTSELALGTKVDRYTFYKGKDGLWFSVENGVNYKFSWSYDKIQKTWNVYLPIETGFAKSYPFRLDKPNIGFFELSFIQKCKIVNGVPDFELDNQGNVIILNLQRKGIYRFNKINL